MFSAENHKKWTTRSWKKSKKSRRHSSCWFSLRKIRVKRAKVKMQMRLNVQSPGLNQSQKRKRMRLMRKIWWLAEKGSKIKEFLRDVVLSQLSIILSWVLIKCLYLMREPQIGIHFIKDLWAIHTNHTHHPNTHHNILHNFILLLPNNNSTLPLRCFTHPWAKHTLVRARRSLAQYNLINSLTCRVLRALSRLSTVKSEKDLSWRWKRKRKRDEWKAVAKGHCWWKMNDLISFIENNL